MKNKLNLILVILSISLTNFAMAQNDSYVSIFWKKSNKIPSTLNIVFKHKKECETVSQSIVAREKQNDPVYLYECTELLSQKKHTTSYWFSNMWNEKDTKPIVLPVILENKKICDEISIDMNNIVKSTVKLEHNSICKPIKVY